jgi:acyl-coenzyme A synthetase/AMP-(fatty) acid ligase
MTHASGLLLAASGTIIGGATLCLSANPDHWLNELQSHRATVMLYSPHSASAIATYLRSKQPFPDSLRLFVGYGLSHHAQVAALHLPETVKRTEFYSTPEANFALVQLSQHKPESVGRPLLGNEPLALAAIDPATMTPKRSSQGTLLRAAPGQPGILLFRSNKPTNNQKEDGINANFAEDPAGTIWYSTADLFTRDDEGDYTFFGKAHRTIAHEGSFIPMAKAEAALVRCPCVQDAVLFFDQSNQSWHAIIRSHQQTMFDIHAVTKALNTTLPAGHRPKKLTITTSIYRETNGSVSHVQADALRTQRPTAIISEYTYQPSTQTYERNPRPKASWHVGNQPI